jgi:DNA polymerase-3 subunit gamma/tau
VIFIFATTDPQKIPATILSRCQRFDYRRVSTSQIQSRLEEIAVAEGIQTESGALALIARSSEGSMRDALSLLDQIISFSGQFISVESVRDSIGLVGGQVLLKITTAMIQRHPLDALKWVDEAYQQGHDLRLLARGLTEFLHALLLIHVNAPSSATESISQEEWKALQGLTSIRSIEEIELIFQVIHHGLDWIARSPQPKIVLDVLVIKCATAEALILAPAKKVQEPIPTIPIPMQSHPKQPETITSPAPAQMKTWEGLIEFMRKTRPLLASILEHATHTQFPRIENPASRNLIICFSPEDAYFREQLQSRVYQEQFAQLSKEYLGISVVLQIELRSSGESLAARKVREQKERLSVIREQAENHPIIQEAKSLFGGELGPIEIRENHAKLST